MASMKQRMQYEDDDEILPQEKMQGAEEAEWVCTSEHLLHVLLKFIFV